MGKYKVTYEARAYIDIEVEADDMDQAEELSTQVFEEMSSDDIAKEIVDGEIYCIKTPEDRTVFYK